MSKYTPETQEWLDAHADTWAAARAADAAAWWKDKAGEHKARANKAEARLEELERPACEWAEDDDGVWNTACGNAFVFTDAGPKENHTKFCPYCGGLLVALAAGEESE